MSNISNFTKCADCGACVSICPRGAIKQAVVGGFYKPVVEESLCNGCGLCVKACPVNNPTEQQNIIGAYAGSHKDKKLVLQSSSGGAFSALAQFVLNKGGVVYGAVYSDDFYSVEIKGTTTTAIEKMRKSKYAESSVDNSFANIKNDLQRGSTVLFSGSPCQVAGLKRFLGKEYANLICCDFSCGGFPGVGIYKGYIMQLEKRYGSKVVSVDFRPKTLGWETHAVLVEFENGKKYHSDASLDPYFATFLYRHYTVRDYCLQCEFANNHYSDIVLADFWKHRALSNLKAGKGLSLLLANSQKGAALIEELYTTMDMVKVDTESAKYNLKNKQYTDTVLQKRIEFLQAVEEKGLFDAAEQCVLPHGKKKAIIRIKSGVKKMVNRIK